MHIGTRCTGPEPMLTPLLSPKCYPITKFLTIGLGLIFNYQLPEGRGLRR